MLLVLQHAPFEGPGIIGEMAEGRGIPLLTLRTFRGDPVPQTAAGLRGVLSLGGAMSVNDDLPWIGQEKRLLSMAMAMGLPVLGVCLGAQLVASALGAAVRKGDTPEVGWGEVTLTREGEADVLFGSLGKDFPVLHWHGETFDLPEGGVLLASSASCPCQAFRWGKRAYGLQFHLEATKEMLDRWVEEERRAAQPLVDDPGPLLADGEKRHPRVQFCGALVFAHFLDMLKDNA